MQQQLLLQLLLHFVAAICEAVLGQLALSLGKVTDSLWLSELEIGHHLREQVPSSHKTLMNIHEPLCFIWSQLGVHWLVCWSLRSGD